MKMIRADILITCHVQVVVVTLEEGEEGELDGGHEEVKSEDDSHPLTTNLHEVFRLSPGQIQNITAHTALDWRKLSLTCWW